MIHLKSFAVREFPARELGTFPFTLPLIRWLNGMEFASPVTFFVGENGSGKSTVLETLACAVESIAVGGQSVKTDPALEPLRHLAYYLRLVWTKRTRKGFFLRAEDFFGYVRETRRTREELNRELKEIETDYKDRSAYAASLASMPYKGQLADMERRYGAGLEYSSHGEAYLTLFQSRFVPDGLYLLDEPEAALSPIRQLAFLSALKQMEQKNAQFIIATHSPILLSFPGAQILEFQDDAIHEVKYNQLEHVKLTRDFLNNPVSFLQHL